MQGGGGSRLAGARGVDTRERGEQASITLPPLRPEREQRAHSAEQNDLVSFCERRNHASVDNTCKGFDRRENQRCAFTMAEILLSLTIIGVVAAITLPSLTGNINERTWNTQRKALYARFSQAMLLIPSLNGYGTLTEGNESTSGIDNAAETFITDGLAKVLKINNVCDNEHLEDCGVPAKINTLAGVNIDTPVKLSELNIMNVSASVAYCNTRHSQIDTKAAAFETQNNESVIVYYNPYCRGSLKETERANSQPMMCANFVYDLNGKKGPNTVGKDIGFVSAFYPSDVTVVAPIPASNNLSGKYSQANAGKACTQWNSDYRLPNVTEISAIFTNLRLLSENPYLTAGGDGDNDVYWTSEFSSNGRPWYYSFDIGYANVNRNNTEAMHVRCVRRF